MTARKDVRWSVVFSLLGFCACAESGTSSIDSDGTTFDDDARTYLAQTADAADAPATDAPAADAPAPVSVAAVWGFGIGITDVAAARKFYTEVMKMTVEKEDVKREDRTETVLYATQAKRGARIILMKYDDQRNTRKITAKLVFQASNTPAVNSAARSHPDYKQRMNLGIVQFDGPDTYIHEVGGIFDSGGGARITVPYPIALGFSTTDLSASRKFYQGLGMSDSRLGAFSVTDATGSGRINEYSERFKEGAGIVLQEWSPKRNSKDNPIKVVMMVPNAQAVADKVVAGGGTIVKPAERTPVYDNRLLIVAKDPDGYVLELVQ
ncbi:MAG: hypothetical protein ABW252_04695 [Polyangiales bacterium]